MNLARTFARMKSFSRRGRPSLKLIGALRGAGVLICGDEPVPVDYRLDLFEGGDRRTGNGSLEGPLPALEEGETQNAVLKLADGFELEVTLTQSDAQGATFEAHGELPQMPA